MLMETMDSVAAQSFADWEHVVVDDGSDDGTAEEVARRAAADSRIRWIRRHGGAPGASACRNIGWAAAKAPLVLFLDSDDLLDPDSLTLRVAAMTRNLDLDFCVFRTGVFSKTPHDLGRELNAEVQGDDLQQFLFFELPWQTTAPVWRRAALERLGGFDESLPSWQDVDLHIRAIAARLKYLRYDRVDHHMRWHWEDSKVSIMQRRSSKHLRAATAVLEKFERAVREGPGMNWSRRRALCGLYFLVAEFWIEAGSLKEALKVWRLARIRRLAPRHLELSGALLLRLCALHSGLVQRLIHKWKGVMRLRTNPELVVP